MRVFTDLNQLPLFKKSVLTVGTFDGVHLGHQKLIEKINDEAQSIGGESIIITFHPHPRLVINPDDNSLKLLNTLEEKRVLLEKFGVNNLVVVPFSRSFSEMNARDYVAEFLVKRFNPACIVIGYDHRFGINRSGGIELLKELQTEFNYRLEEISKEMIEDITISSTQIRQALMLGKTGLANGLAGHRYVISGTVVKGLQNGRKLGYPTANISVPESHKLIPANGIYAVFVWHGRQKYKGMLNIGYNPTFNGVQQTIEVNILDFNEDIYGNHITVELVDYIRPEIKFENVEQLIDAIDKDKEVITAKLSGLE
jgi:riboflavin kinase/FMN adenylyltransferase